MTAAWSLLALLGLGLIVAGCAFKNAGWLVLSLPYLVFILFPWWKKRPMPEWRLAREVTPNSARSGQPVQVSVVVTNLGPDLEEVSLHDSPPQGVAVEGESSFHGRFPAGQSRIISYPVRGQRGAYDFPGLRLRLEDPLGLSAQEAFLPCPARLAVLPAVERLGKIPISPRRTRVYSGSIRSREGGAGLEFFGTRPYMPGDPPRRLNWRAGARWDQLVTNLFEQERVADVGIILDARRIAEVRAGEESLFEHLVRAAASLAMHFLDQGNRVGLLIYGTYLQWIYPGYGKVQAARLLGALAGAELGDHVVFQEFDRLPLRLFPQQSQMVLVSPLRRQDVLPLRHLRALGYQVLIVSPDPISFELKYMPAGQETAMAAALGRLERRIILSSLRRSGARVVDWPVESSLAANLKLAWSRQKPWSFG